VSADELLDLRARFPHGGWSPRVEESRFDLAEYERFLSDNAEAIAAFQRRQRSAFDAERDRWAAAGVSAGHDAAIAEPPPTGEEAPLADGAVAVTSPVAGSVWKLLVTAGQRVRAGDAVAIVEAMKTEIGVLAADDGIVSEVLVEPGTSVSAGTRVIVLAAAP
jgi:urea carboxylase